MNESDRVLDPRDLTLEFGGFMQGRFDALAGPVGFDLSAIYSKGKYSKAMFHGIYLGVQFSAEFYRKQEKLKVELNIRVPRLIRSENPFGEPGTRVSDKGLTRRLGGVEEKIFDTSELHCYSTTCSILQKDGRVSFSEAYHDIVQNLIKQPLGSAVEHVRKIPKTT